MLIPFGVLSAAGAGGVAGDYELIASEILTTTESSITFSNLGDYSSTYKHLQIRASVRTSRTETSDNLLLRLNGNSTAGDYHTHSLVGVGSVVASEASGSFTGAKVMQPTGATAIANNFDAGVIDILDAYATKNKTLRTLSGNAGDNNRIWLTSNLWNNTASITDIELLPAIGLTLAAGSRFSLYGIRG
jgi:hypothetical protein